MGQSKIQRGLLAPMPPTLYQSESPVICSGWPPRSLYTGRVVARGALVIVRSRLAIQVSAPALPSALYILERLAGCPARYGAHI
jgi:hypothetical protein